VDYSHGDGYHASFPVDSSKPNMCHDRHKEYFEATLPKDNELVGPVSAPVNPHFRPVNLQPIGRSRTAAGKLATRRQ
jgi:hypothetical protein